MPKGIRYLTLFLVAVSLFSCTETLTEKEVKENGSMIAASAAKELSTNLMSKMKEGGIPLAVDYCNTAAIPITDKISTSYGVEIKRTSLKTRNALNKPSDTEKEILEKFATDHKNGDVLEAKVKFEDANTHYYSPIMIEKKCLMCHGTLNKELSQSADSILKSKYPNDLATGYSEGELRGMWSITFPAN